MLTYKQKYGHLISRVNEMVFDLFIDEVAKTWSNPENITRKDAKNKYKKVCQLIRDIDRIIKPQVDFLDRVKETKKKGGVV